jgi:hypothetical protein
MPLPHLSGGFYPLVPHLSGGSHPPTLPHPYPTYQVGPTHPPYPTPTLPVRWVPPALPHPYPTCQVGPALKLTGGSQSPLTCQVGPAHRPDRWVPPPELTCGSRTLATNEQVGPIA